jgi:hypothetical protein
VASQLDQNPTLRYGATDTRRYRERISCLALLRKLPALWLIGHVRLYFNGYIENLQTYNNLLHFSVHLHKNCSLIHGVSGGISLYEIIYWE